MPAKRAPAVKRWLGWCGLGFLALAGCTVAPVAPAPTGIDWAHAPVVQIRLAVGFFHPGALTLPRGRPVRLVFLNDGGRTHDFVTDLFTAVATRPGTRPGGVRVILQVADQVEYDIVPEKPGTYTLVTVMFEPAGAVPAVPITIR